MSGGGKSGGGTGKDLHAQGLKEITEGITRTLDELREVGMIGEASTGRGFDNISLTGMQVGYSGLASAFSSFCERWEWGVRSLVAEGNALAKGAGLSAGTYYETDQYVDGSLKVITNSVIGNPNLTEEEVTSKDWGTLIKDNNALSNPDWSGGSFSDAWDDSKEAYGQAEEAWRTPDPSLDPDRLEQRFKEAGIEKGQG
ncbi:hypothetical protein [Streptomyces xanthii]|uniref:Uncharacterized protein n=1 Tax=Streptomyces xanthii TaxID=2768069 RepID=A0A7H1B8K9_9ACTN|nr:hypothetical protein [Streptomyces xanthii]QNS05064.1 hypothetical protein IAG42_16565 [Streptomyces xanthii]